MKAEHNQLLTRVGAGTDAGALLRWHWHPVARLADLDAAPTSPRAVRLLGQELVLFRDALGRFGLLGSACPHRGADLALAAHEGDGLRCALHGWKFDVDGICLDMPLEPPGSALCKRVRQRRHAVRAAGGLLFAWLGADDAEPPPLPRLQALAAPEHHRQLRVETWQCNWLQALELALDPQPGAPREGAAELRLDSPLPGALRLTWLRSLQGGQTHLRIALALLPATVIVPVSQNLTLTRFFVPLDDASTAVYSVLARFDAPLADAAWPDDVSDARARRLAESMGTVQDRAREHLGSADKALLAWRRMLLKAIDTLRLDGRPPLDPAAGGAAQPDSIECVVPAHDWQRAGRQAIAARRAASSWLQQAQPAQPAAEQADPHPA